MFDCMLALIDEFEIQAITHQRMDLARDEDAAGFRQTFEACGYVDAFAVDVLSVVDNIADVHANAKFEGAVG